MRDWWVRHPDYQRERYAANREKMLEWRRKYRERRRQEGKLFPSEVADRKEYARQYRKANREVIKERIKKSQAKKPDYYRALFKAASKRWRLANLDKLREREREYRKANRERRRVAEKKKRAKRRGAPGNGWTAADVENQYKAQRGRCFYCKKNLGKDFHREHVIPLARGGHHCRSNMVLACAACNMAKGAHGPEFMGLLL